MASKLGVYNAALLHLGQEPLSALSDEGTARRKLDAAYDDVVEWCLEQGFWNHAMRLVEMEASPSLSTDFGFTFVYEKPDDWVRTAALTTDEYRKSPLLEYEDRTDYWLADVEPVYLWYVSNDADYGLDLGRWPQTFSTFVEYALAQKTCKGITGSSETRDDLYKLMIRAKRDASNKDAMNEPSKFPATGSWVRSRGTSGSSDRGPRGRLIG